MIFPSFAPLKMSLARMLSRHIWRELSAMRDGDREKGLNPIRRAICTHCEKRTLNVQDEADHAAHWHVARLSGGAQNPPPSSTLVRARRWKMRRPFPGTPRGFDWSPHN